jgi:hypothetical protein
MRDLTDAGLVWSQSYLIYRMILVHYYLH